MGSPHSRKPSTAKDSLTSSTYLDDHLEYKTHQTGPSTSIDGVLEQPSHALQNTVSHTSLTSRRSISAIPPSPRIAQESGMVHTISHTHCIPEPGDPARLVATIYYNSTSPRHPHVHPDQSPPARPTDPIPIPEIAEGSAPTTSISEYPLEPPPPEPEPLDHLYGAYISQLCLTHFLSALDSLLIHNKSEERWLISSHRCLAPDPFKPRVMEVTFSPPPNAEYLPLHLLSKHESIYRFEREWNCEIVLQPSNVYRRHKRLCVFDMDSTLIQHEVIDEVAAYVGVKKEVAAITERAMNGELDFAASLKARVALLKGVPSDVFDQLKPKIVITPGAKELCKCLKRLGFTLAVLSGGFQPLADWLAGELGLDYAFANHLVADPETQTLTGELEPSYPIVDSQFKRNRLISLAAEKNIPLAQTIAVGDGANDIPMLKTAGLGVAWKAKSKVQMEAPARLNIGDSMLDLVYLLGLTREEIDELLKD
ncbi:phosphoserine phosphatase SerB [Rhinocladiella mackenziei CBS 650.93]|uniref:phosphoserine phosphatase n=1 Tax=Rhinocladiella mackenziei CBS 650.93 TaxID=1442369 RepID=A0A0D2H2R1_9EURO|nr:phosphoserine phosphatase SerB [Rhinocladiella mackenziei CBS 650.93]KIX04718.1 phosphoserine phosphatase SerB [Rhinocladiella mackenziei CBS 650.93]